MASVVDRVRKLLALSASGNPHEARNAALLAAKLIREHGLELHEPAVSVRRTTPSSPRTTPSPRKTPSNARRSTPSQKKSTGGSKRGVRAMPDAPAPIESPLGGDCVVCGRRYRAGTNILWSQADGGMHTSCLDEWLRRSKR